MNAEDVRLPQHLLYVFKILAILGGVGVFISGVVNDAHGECVCKGRDPQSDAPKTKNCEGFACDITSFRTNSTRLPFSVSERMFGKGELTKCREQEVQSCSGGCIVYCRRGV